MILTYFICNILHIILLKNENIRKNQCYIGDVKIFNFDNT